MSSWLSACAVSYLMPPLVFVLLSRLCLGYDVELDYKGFWSLPSNLLWKALWHLAAVGRPCCILPVCSHFYWSLRVDLLLCCVSIYSCKSFLVLIYDCGIGWKLFCSMYSVITPFIIMQWSVSWSLKLSQLMRLWYLSQSDQRRLRKICASAQSCQSLRCSRKKV